jgi:hypothetical protein
MKSPWCNSNDVFHISETLFRNLSFSGIGINCFSSIVILKIAGIEITVNRNEKILPGQDFSL